MFVDGSCGGVFGGGNMLVGGVDVFVFGLIASAMVSGGSSVGRR